MRIIRILIAIVLIAAATFWWITRPQPLTDADFAGLTGDAGHGQQVFTAAGCASCHMAEGATGAAELILSGGQKFPSPFGTFTAPNISTDPVHGIGGWTLPQVASAVMRGVDPKGQHLYPVLPYPAYNKMTRQDMADLYAYLVTLPPSDMPSAGNEVPFPFSVRRLVGVWKFMFLTGRWRMAEPETAEVKRGRYIVEALAHCSECHTPRNVLGAKDRGHWLAGVKGKGGAPNITPARLTWTADEIVEYLTSGFTPDYDSVGGHMALVVENTARLPESDRRAIVAYLKATPAVE